MIAGDFVVPAAAMAAGNTVHAKRPILGVVESLVAGSPPTNVLVNWQDGTSVTYATSGTGATSVIYRIGGLIGSLPLPGIVVRPKSTSGIPNPGGRIMGPIVDHLSLTDPSTDAAIAEVVVFETPIGFYVLDVNDVEVVPSA